MLEGPMLWFVNRGTGIVLLVLMTLTVCLGILTSHGRAGRAVPAFVSQHLHRNVGLLSGGLLAVHAVSAVVDTYVDITWWQALVPWGGTYRPVWLGLGALALDLTLAVTLTSLLRHRLSPRAWRAVHLASYLAWAVAILHGIGIGTDSRAPWSLWVNVGCLVVVVAALVQRAVVELRRTVRA